MTAAILGESLAAQERGTRDARERLTLTAYGRGGGQSALKLSDKKLRILGVIETSSAALPAWIDELPAKAKPPGLALDPGLPVEAGRRF
jgi:hypothetical protein